MATFDPSIYLGNPNLPSAKAQFEYTPEMLTELKRCADNIAHFAETHFFITTMDHGKIKIKLFKPQRRILKSLGAFNRVVCLASRQSGKCGSGGSKILVRNVKTNKTEEISLECFHELVGSIKKEEM